MHRRNLIKSLAVLPALLVAKPEIFALRRTLRLPIDCDLSCTAFEYALNIGLENNLGEPRQLICSTNVYHTGLKVLMIAQNEGIGKGVLHEWNPQMAPYSWTVDFERGAVGSRGPC